MKSRVGSAWSGQTPVAVWLGATLALLACAAAEAAPLRIISGSNFPPLIEEQPEGMRGLLPDVLNEVLPRCSDGAPQIRGVPWNRALAIIQAGEADAIATVATKERLVQLEASRVPVLVSPFRVYAARDNPRIDQLRRVTSLSELAGFKVGSYSGNGWVHENLNGFHVDYSATSQSLTLQMLAHQRFDVVIENEYAARYLIRQGGLSGKIEELPAARIGAVPWHLLVRRDYPGVHELLACFDREMVSFRNSPKWSELKRLYLGR
jgi:polar amino acid transport system substrate-binding protein